MAAPVLLIVDDDPIIVAILERMLSARGFAVEAAGSVASGKALGEQHPELAAAIIDLGLPDGSGWTLIDWLRQERPELPLIVMSGDSPDASGARAANAYVTKPFQPDFADLVDRLVKGVSRAPG